MKGELAKPVGRRAPPASPDLPRPAAARTEGMAVNGGERPPLADTRGRSLRDLRISVTDRCNFRCVYCMPREVFGADHAFLDRKEVLSLEEIARIAALFVGQGVRKIRLTGGEPLVRRGLETLVEKLAAIPGIEDLSLTTNGSLLTPARARALREAGLGRITVSLDALDDAVFKRINDVNFPVSGVLRAIDAAAEAGLAPVKVNMVVKRGGNEDQIVPMARRFRGTGQIVRYIEYMDVGNTNGWELADVVPAREIVARIDARHPLDPIGANYPGEVARRWRYRDGAGEIGVIASVSQPFCGGCTRARLSAEGRLYTCLFATSGHDLRAMLRSGASDGEVRSRLARIWERRADRYSELRTAATRAPAAVEAPRIEMSYIGG